MILLVNKLRIHTYHRNLTCKILNTYKVLIWRLIPKKYGRDKEYIKGGKIIVADTLSRITLNGNQETTHDSTYQK